MARLGEGEIEIDFSSSVDAGRMDVQGDPIPIGMKFVDFVVEEPDNLFLIEIKDPCASKVTSVERKKFLKRLRDNQLIHHELTPKARDSYTFLHLMQRDNKRMVFILLLGGSFDDELILNLKDRLLRRIRQEAALPWAKRYIADCIVLTEDSWRRHFPEYALSRRSPP